MKRNRWIILTASIIINMCIGSAYAWSVFQNPLIDMFGWSTSETSLAFTLSLVFVPFAMIFAGKLQDSFGVKRVTLFGGIVFGLGIFLTSTVQSLFQLYLYYGLIGGMGIGLVYACMISNTIKWFPDKRGLAGGLIAMGFGLGAIVFAPLGITFIQSMGVLNTFAAFGVLFSVLIILGSLFVSAPDMVHNAKTVQSNAHGLTPQAMTKTLRFYTLWVLFAIGCVGGLMIIGHASPIVQQKTGISAAQAAIIVSMVGLANSLGRVFWGYVSDRLGRMVTLTIMYGVGALCLLALSLFSTYMVVIIALWGIALCFGGYLGIMPSICADQFGPKHIGINYGILFTAFGFAAFAGPRLASWIRDISAGSYDLAFTVVMIANIIAIVVSAYLALEFIKKTVAAHAKKSA